MAETPLAGVGAIVPHPGEQTVPPCVRVQVTPLLPKSFETVAVNAAVAPNVGPAELGETATEIACKLIVKVAVFEESETEVAVIVTVPFAEIGEGAV